MVQFNKNQLWVCKVELKTCALQSIELPLNSSANRASHVTSKKRLEKKATSNNDLTERPLYCERAGIEKHQRNAKTDVTLIVIFYSLTHIPRSLLGKD
jgi:hypothetical protein